MHRAQRCSTGTTAGICQHQGAAAIFRSPAEDVIQVHHARDLVLLRQWGQDPDRDLPQSPSPTLHPPQPQMGSESRARLPRATRLLGVWDRQCFSKGTDFN